MLDEINLCFRYSEGSSFISFSNTENDLSKFVI